MGIPQARVHLTFTIIPPTSTTVAPVSPSLTDIAKASAGSTQELHQFLPLASECLPPKTRISSGFKSTRRDHFEGTNHQVSVLKVLAYS